MKMLTDRSLFVQHQLFVVYLRTNQQSVAMIIILSSFVALAYNITHNFLLQRTSAVTVTVLGEVKIVGLLLLSAILLPGEADSSATKSLAEFEVKICCFSWITPLPFALQLMTRHFLASKQIGSNFTAQLFTRDTVLSTKFASQFSDILSDCR